MQNHRDDCRGRTAQQAHPAQAAHLPGLAVAAGAKQFGAHDPDGRLHPLIQRPDPLSLARVQLHTHGSAGQVRFDRPHLSPWNVELALVRVPAAEGLGIQLDSSAAPAPQLADGQPKQYPRHAQDHDPHEERGDDREGEVGRARGHSGQLRNRHERGNEHGSGANRRGPDHEPGFGLPGGQLRGDVQGAVAPSGQQGPLSQPPGSTAGPSGRDPQNDQLVLVQQRPALIVARLVPVDVLIGRRRVQGGPGPEWRMAPRPLVGPQTGQGDPGVQHEPLCPSHKVAPGSRPTCFARRSWCRYPAPIRVSRQGQQEVSRCFDTDC